MKTIDIKAKTLNNLNGEASKFKTIKKRLIKNKAIN